MKSYANYTVKLRICNIAILSNGDCYNSLMAFTRRHARRILIDTAGYLLLLAALLTGWLPGPGGIPLALAGLGLLALYNPWARQLREYILAHGNDIVRKLFLDNALLQAVYDIVVGGLLITAAFAAWRHGEAWQTSSAIALFFAALAIGLANRNRYSRLKSRLKHKRLK